VTKPVHTNGSEWIVDARGCSAQSLCCLDTLKSLFEEIIADLGLRTIGETRWHQFPRGGGITGLCLLSESHLACHTFPEYGSLCLNLFCCVPREAWDFERNLARLFGATSVNVVVLTREYGPLEELQAVGRAQEVRRG
jgi:S-adenosylmethionine decarboxylase